MTEVEARIRIAIEKLKEAKKLNTCYYGPEIHKCKDKAIIRVFDGHVSEEEQHFMDWLFDVFTFSKENAIGKLKPKPWEIEVPIDEERSICVYEGIGSIVNKVSLLIWNP